MATGRLYPYGCPHPLIIYMDIHTDIRADVHVELSVLRIVRPGSSNVFTKDDESKFVTALLVTLKGFIFALFGF